MVWKRVTTPDGRPYWWDVGTSNTSWHAPPPPPPVAPGSPEAQRDIGFHAGPQYSAPHQNPYSAPHQNPYSAQPQQHYGSQPYGAPQQQYGPPQQHSGAPQSYGAPPAYGSAQQYGAPPAPQQYGAPPAPQQYGAPPAPQQYGAPPAPQQFGAPPAPQQFGAPPAPQQYGAPPAPQQFGAPRTAAPAAAPMRSAMAAPGAVGNAPPAPSFGMAQPTEYKLKDSNVENIGSDMDKAQRKAKAMSDPNWQGSGMAPGIQVWRVENHPNNFGVNKWPTPGKFTNGDSFLVLSTKANAAGGFDRDVYYWIGASSTQDEYGTAALKATELDDYFDGTPIQHRECQDSESDSFLQLWNPPRLVTEGGFPSGFKRVADIPPMAPKMYWVKGKGRKVRVTQVPCARASMNSGDVFIIQAPGLLVQWNGRESGGFEKARGATVLQALEPSAGAQGQTVEEDAAHNHPFWSVVQGGPGPVAPASAGGSDAEVDFYHKSLHRLSDSSGSLVFSQVAQGQLSRQMLDPSDIFVVDVGAEVFVWVGAKASDAEKRSAMQYAENYLQQVGRPKTAATRVLQGAETQWFWSFFN